MTLKNNYKIFTFSLIFLILFTLFIVWPVNYVVDPYGKNHRFNFSGNKEKFIRDERIDKFKLLEDNKNAKSFIFGSSRSLMLDAVKLSELTNTEALNLGFSSASSSEYYFFIKYLIETRDVSNIVISIDLFSYTENFNSNGIMPAKLLSYFNIDDGPSHKDYVSFNMFIRSWDTLSRNYSKKKKFNSQYTARGKIIKRDYLEISNDKIKRKKFVETNVVNSAPRWGSTNSKLSNESLGKLLQIKQLCDKYKINLYLFMNPLYIKQITMRNNRFSHQKELLKFIVTRVSPVYDFNTISNLNLDADSFVDPFHYSYEVADFILKEIFENKTSQNSEKRVYVTKNNLDKHLNNVESRIKNLIEIKVDK